MPDERPTQHQRVHGDDVQHGQHTSLLPVAELVALLPSLRTGYNVSFIAVNYVTAKVGFVLELLETVPTHQLPEGYVDEIYHMCRDENVRVTDRACALYAAHTLAARAGDDEMLAGLADVAEVSPSAWFPLRLRGFVVSGLLFAHIYSQSRKYKNVVLVR